DRDRSEIPPPDQSRFPNNGRSDAIQDTEPPSDRFDPARLPRFEVQALRLPASFMDRYEAPHSKPYFVVRAPNERVLRAEPPWIAEQVPPDLAVGPHSEWHGRNRRDVREVTLLGPGRTTIQVGRSIRHELEGLRRLAWELGLTGLGVFGAGLLGGWWLSSRAVKPISTMSETVSEINASNLSRRLDLKGFDTELGRLGLLINGMLERLEGSFAQQVRFAADASHELRTPLAVIRAQAEVALSKPREGPAYREALEACERSATRMTTLVEDLLTLARADSGRLELRVEPIDLGQVARNCVSTMMPLARPQNIRINLQDGPAPFQGDAVRMEQVLTNLLNNAIQYNRPGGQVTLITKLEGNHVIVEVADTGVGIPEADLPRIFDRFHRVDVARSRQSGGSGLGLSICRSIVEAHQGILSATSTLDVGTCFRVEIPRYLDADADSQGFP
ncbi:MAG TPA: ATP-binding protein, partial [Isosphaeraceae bacterium]|nr:ATP-binding protein [Isosphaeraceae bacterium]